jgi:Holliday junction resolvasome RuvABC DNA-binding subunit
VEISEDKVSEVATFHTDAVLALKGLGFTKDVAMRAVREAFVRDAPHDLESLIKAALRRCGSS